jgi:probable HAF family extracellular repeat protein
MIGLGDLPGGGLVSSASDVSPDGRVVVGEGTSALGQEAFLWTQNGGIVGLGDLPDGNFFSTALAVSANGALVVGQGSSAAGYEAFIWDASRGMRSLRNVLINDFGLGSSLAGWTLTAANDISADGQFIVGSGINPDGNQEAWLARLTSEPAFPGDFNNDGAVDAADHVVWRTGLGTTYTARDYDDWRAHFGKIAGSGASDRADAAVPEPTALTICVVAMIAWLTRAVSARCTWIRRRIGPL